MSCYSNTKTAFVAKSSFPGLGIVLLAIFRDFEKISKVARSQRKQAEHALPKSETIGSRLTTMLQKRQSKRRLFIITPMVDWKP